MANTTHTVIPGHFVGGPMDPRNQSDPAQRRLQVRVTQTASGTEEAVVVVDVSTGKQMDQTYWKYLLSADPDRLPSPGELVGHRYVRVPNLDDSTKPVFLYMGSYPVTVTAKADGTVDLALTH